MVSSRSPFHSFSRTLQTRSTGLYVELRHQDSDRRERGVRLVVVVQRGELHPAGSAAGELADLDGGFGVHRHPQLMVGLVRLPIHPMDLLEDGVGLRDLFFGLVFCTLRSV